jgi:fructan beta-fructosidase
MSRIRTTIIIATIVCICTTGAYAADREFTFEGKYLNFPVANEAPPCLLSLEINGKKVREFVMNLAPGEPDYWIYLEVQDFIGKKGTLNARKLPDNQMKGFKAIYNDDTFPGEENLYKEKLRPQFHFSSKRGWINDPNGLVYYKGEYHLFYQHNPFRWDWGNMTWGHAISTDLVHWVEQGDKLHADEMGTVFSGGGVVDWNNTTGFQTGNEPPLIGLYTSAGSESAWSEGEPFTQSIAYSNDRGRTWTKYKGNPVLPNIEPIDRDPKAIWHEPTNQWVIALHFERGATAFFTSKDLKKWDFQSEMKSDYMRDCPELFQLAVDGDPDNKRWVIYGGSGHYYLGEFDGKGFNPETGPTRFNYGNLFFASQTFSDVPESDGRRIQIAWGTVSMPDMPFNQQMTFPVELTLHTTDDGLRIFAYPVEEIRNIHGKKYRWRDEELEPGENPLENVKGNLFDIDTEIELGDADEVGFEINGCPVADMVRENLLIGGTGEEGARGFGQGETKAELRPTDGKISLRILVDRSSVEIFANKGRIYMPMQAIRDLGNRSLKIYAKGGAARIEELTVHEVKSIWP